MAYPSYNNSILKGRRAEAQVALTELLQQQERYMTQRNTYLAFTTASGGVTNPTTAPFKAFSGANISDANYLLSAEQCPATGGGSLAITECVRVLATPIRSDTEAGTLRMTSSGTKDCTGTKPDVCWK